MTKNLWSKEYASNIDNWDFNNNQYYQKIDIYVGKGKEVTISFPTPPNNLANLYVCITLDNTYASNYKTWIYNQSISGTYVSTVTIKADIDDYIRIHVHDINNNLRDFMTYIGNDLQIEYGSTKTDYEPYTEQPFTFQTPNGLRGIPLGTTIPDAIKNSPIHMSGVYWDNAEGRYYIGDTKNENGNDVQRIGKDRLLASKLSILDSYCNEESNFFYISLSTNYLLQTNVDDYICDITKANLQQGVRDTENHGYLNMSSDGLFYIRLRKDSGVATLEEFEEYLTNNEVFIYIILKEPIITETDVQHDVVMNYPTTTIINDAGAYMKVEYVADTKCYIDKKFNELQATISSAIAQLL